MVYQLGFEDKEISVLKTEISNSQLAAASCRVFNSVGNNPQIALRSELFCVASLRLARKLPEQSSVIGCAFGAGVI